MHRFGKAFRAVPLFLLLTAAVELPSSAWAEERDPRALARARQLFQQGINQFDAGEPDAALRSFEESYELHSHPETLHNIATILGRLARYREAIQSYRRYLWEATQVTTNRRREVVAEIERMEDLLCSVSIRVLPVGAMILVDGVQAGRAPLGQAIQTDPGAHVVIAQLDGYREQSAEVTAEVGGTLEVVLELVPLPARLTVTDAAPGATIEVDGVPIGTHPLNDAVELSMGRHVVRALAPGYEAAERVVEAGPGADLHVELAAPRQLTPPRLRLDGEENATITIDGDPVGSLPWEGEVEAGDRAVVIEGEGLHRWEGTLSLRRGDRTVVDVRLGRRPSGPSPAWIWTMAGLSLVAGATALGFGIGALEAESEFDDLSTSIQAREFGGPEELEAMQRRGRDLEQEAHAYSIVCDISWITAIGAAAIALVLTLVREWGEEGPNVTFSSTTDEESDENEIETREGAED